MNLHFFRQSRHQSIEHFHRDKVRFANYCYLQILYMESQGKMTPDDAIEIVGKDGFDDLRKHKMIRVTKSRKPRVKIPFLDAQFQHVKDYVKNSKNRSENKKIEHGSKRATLKRSDSADSECTIQYNTIQYNTKQNKDLGRGESVSPNDENSVGGDRLVSVPFVPLQKSQIFNQVIQTFHIAERRLEELNNGVNQVVGQINGNHGKLKTGETIENPVGYAIGCLKRKMHLKPKRRF